MGFGTEDHLEFVHRFLEEVASNGTAGNETVVSPRDSVIIASTLRTYGSLYLVLIVIFCFVRVKYPRAYNVRSWSPLVKSSLAAKDHFGAISWFWNVWFVSDEDFLEHCGMDALAFTRIYRFGIRIALVGMFNSLWLMPVYGSAPKTGANEHITDHLAMVTVGHIPPGSPRFLATVIAAYIQFGAIMYLLLKEFEWFTANRHKYLSEAKPRNYTVYVSHIPEEYRTSAKLLDYFRSCFSPDAVLEAHVALKIPTLEKEFQGREGLVNKLEHAINVEEVTGKTPTHREMMVNVNSIDSYTEQLNESNEIIKDLITDINQKNNPYSFKNDLEAEGGSVRFDGGHSVSERSLSTLETNPDISSHYHPNLEKVPEVVEGSASNLLEHSEQSVSILEDSDKSTVGQSGLDNSEKSAHRLMLSSIKSARQKVTGTVGGVAGNIGGVASKGLSFVMRSEDGEAREAGFVTFSNLKSQQAALQQIHSETPFVFEVAEAPEPNDIFWTNVGKTHKSLQLGKLASFSLTALLCLFWTIPVATVVTFTEVESLKGILPFLADWVEAFPALELILAQMAPLMLIVIKALLPIILGIFSTLEGPVSSSVLESSLFVKLALFEIIQTFFVSTFSGSITSELTNIVNDPGSVVDLLATSIPGQSSYFLQILFVQTFLGQGLELLRVVPLAKAGIRKLVGPRLTEKERNTTFGPLNTLADPNDFEFADVVSNGILYWMVLFVYGSLAPAANWFLAFCFCIMISGYRHQLIFNYPAYPDSGGQLWVGFIGIALTCMLIAEFTLLGLLALKKATIAAPLMFPLIITTILFNFYVRQRHFLVSSRLPSRTALKKDLKNQEQGRMDMSFVTGKYLQPALQSVEEVYPENFGATREMEQERIAFMTPPASETDIEEHDSDVFKGDFDTLMASL